MSWVQIQKNFVSFIDNKEIIYTPPEEEGLISMYSLDESERTRGINKYTGKIKSSEYFENGNLEFEVKFDTDRFAYLNVVISGYIFAINSAIANSAYSIRKSGNDNTILDKSGERGTVPINHFFKIKIVVGGSNVSLLINDVVVCSCNEVISRSQVTLALRSTNRILIKNFKISKIRPQVFVVMQFTEEYNQLYSDVIKPICEKEFDYECKRGDEYFTTGFILKDIIEAINASSIIIADITPNNPNVFYEVGYAHALNKPTVLLSDKKRDKLPFDVSAFRTLFYDNTIGGKAQVEDMLRKHLNNINSEYRVWNTTI